MRPIFFPSLAIPMSPKTRSERFRAWLETWLPVRFGPRTFDYSLGDPSCKLQGQFAGGDDKTLDTCRNKFDNVRSFMGEPYIPPPESES
jgi:hypothetical protein